MLLKLVEAGCCYRTHCTNWRAYTWQRDV